jgi:hypothetical protein
MANNMSFKPQHPIVLHPWGCFYSMVIERDFVPKGVEQFGHSSQDPDLEYTKYSVLLFREQRVLNNFCLGEQFLTMTTTQ